MNEENRVPGFEDADMTDTERQADNAAPADGEILPGADSVEPTTGQSADVPSADGDDQSDAAEAAEDTAAEQSCDPDEAGVDPELKNEMEDIRKVFIAEMDKAKAQIGQDNEDAESGEDGEPEEALPLCSRCGENPVDRSVNTESEFCVDCRKKLAKTRYSAVAIIGGLAVIMATVLSIWLFTQARVGIVYAAKGKWNELTGKLGAAVDSYSDALSFTYGKEVEKDLFVSAQQTLGEKIMVLTYRAGSFSSAAQQLQTLCPDGDVGTLKTAEGRRVGAGIAVLQDELDACYGAVIPFVSYGASDYDSCLKALTARRETIVSPEPATADEDETSPAQKEDRLLDEKTEQNYRLAACDYYIWITCDALGDSETALEKLESVRTLAPDAYFLYLDSLCDSYIVATAAGDDRSADVRALIAEAKRNNREDAPVYGVESMLNRVCGDFDAALASARAGREVDQSNFELMRQEAIAHMCKDELEDAFTLLETCFTQDGNLTVNEAETYALCALAMGNDDAVSQVEQIYSNYGLEFGEAYQAFAAGQKTLVEIFTTGRCDVA